MYLTQEQRSAIASSTPGLLDVTIERIKEKNPRAFHTEETLPTRVFFDQPARNEPCKRFVRKLVRADI